VAAGAQLSLPPCEHIDRWVSMSSVERSFYERLHKQVLSTQAQHQASQKSRRTAASSRNPTRSGILVVLCFIAYWSSNNSHHLLSVIHPVNHAAQLCLQSVIACVNGRAETVLLIACGLSTTVYAYVQRQMQHRNIC